LIEILNSDDIQNVSLEIMYEKKYRLMAGWRIDAHKYFRKKYQIKVGGALSEKLSEGLVVIGFFETSINEFNKTNKTGSVSCAKGRLIN
jgi:hypothetical protein